MNKTKLLSLILLIVVTIMTVAATSCLKTCGGKSEESYEEVTVTFDAMGGSEIEPMTIKKGEKIEDLPQAYLAGRTFDGWYTDEAVTEEFNVDTVIISDTTLYAGYTEILSDVNVASPTSAYIENVQPNYAVTIITTKAYSVEELFKAIKIESMTSILPWELADELDESLPKTVDGWYDVGVNGFEYTLTPKKFYVNDMDVYAYNEGRLYKITLPSDMKFKGMEDSVVEYGFRIEYEIKDNVREDVEYKDEGSIIFVSKDDVLNLNSILETKIETGTDGIETETTSFVKGENGYYNLQISAEVYRQKEIAKDRIVCIGNGDSLDSQSLFVKVAEIAGNPDADEIVLVFAMDAEVEEVFDKIDVNYNKPITAEEILANLDTEEMENIIKTNGSVEKVTDLMTNLIFVSDEAQDAYKADYQAKTRKTRSTINPETGLPAFCDNTYITNEKKLLSANLLKDAEVTISAGVGHNPNFDSAYTDNFAALKITFSYETTIKDRLEIKAEIVFTQFLAASAQGYLNYGTKYVVVIDWVEFDAAVSLYSQTDFDFKILVRTVRPDGDTGNNDKNSGEDEDDENPFVNIADKISEKLKDEDGDDPNNLVAELRDMLDSENGYLELFRAPILRIPIDIIPGFPVMTVNIKLDFIIEMNFAAGFSAHISVLEAVQVGVKGDTRSKTLSSYKYDNLPGGNQYAVQLSACGYLGIRAGFKGGMSIGFCGLSSLGDVGIYVYVGPYVDIYGFAQATFVKEQYSAPTQSLVGGYYVEIGIFLDITLEARSDMFGVKVGTSLFNEKWPLVTFGNKEVLVSIHPNDIVETIYIENKGENTASISVNVLPKLQGTYLDITTGKTTVKEVPWDKVGLRMSSSSFVYDHGTKTINYRNLNSTKLISETCTATYHYKGSIMQFNASAEKYKEYYPFAQVKIVYYDSTQIDKENAGQEVKVRLYSLVDGKKELMEERSVMTGTIIRDYATLDPYKYTNIKWDKVPHATQITQDTDFVCSGDLRQAYIAFIQYDMDKDVWVTDIRVVNIGEVPIAPEVKSSDKVHFTNWRGYDGINCNVKHTPSEGVGRTFTVGDMWVYGYFIPTTSGKDVTKSLITYVPETYSRDIYESLFDTEHTADNGFSWYYAVTSIYVAGYDYDDCKVTIHSVDANGVKHEDEFTVAYNRQPTTYYTYSPLTMKFVGFALEEDGEVVYEQIYDLGNLRKDVVLYAKYEIAVHEIKLYRYNAATNEYTLYKTTTLNGGQRVKDLGDLLEEIKVVDEVDGVECAYACLTEEDGEWLSPDTICVTPMEIYPYFRRTVKVVFDANGGVIPRGEGEPVTQVDYVAESIWDYKIFDFPVTCVKTSNDPKYRYEHVGWKNELTGEEIYFEDPSDKKFVAVCDRVTTLTAIYKEVERTDYSVSIKTPYGVLKDGVSKEIVLDNITYDEYLKYKTEYDEWKPADYRDDENHCTYVQNGIMNFAKENRYEIEYMFKKVIDTHTIRLNFNGGDTGNNTVVYQGKEWNSEIDLSTIQSTRKDEYGTWRMVNWTDTYGNTYALTDTYYVLGDDVLTLNWEIVTSEEYTIWFYLDDKLIETKIYHKDDSLADIGKPKQADGKVFSGWTWTNAATYEEIEPQAKMPALNLYLRGTTTEVYIRYVVDGKEIDKSVGKVDYEEKVKDVYVKEGYTATAWSTTDATVVDGKFTMPEKDVTFTATTTVNSYKLTYYHKGAVYGTVQTIAYGTLVRLPDVPTEEGVEYVWASDEVTLYDTGFYMPANDVTITTVSVESMQYVVYYVNDEIVWYEKAVTGQKVRLLDLSQDDRYSGMTFSGWYGEGVSIQSDSTFIVGDDNLFVYGYFTTGTTKINIYFDATKSSPDLVLYANNGDAISVAPKLSDQDIVGYKVNGVVTTEIAVKGTTEMNAYVQYENKKYQVSYDGYGYTLPESKYYAVGAKVELPENPKGLDSQIFEGWFLAETELLTENGKTYFIMPEKDVVVNVKYSTSAKPESCKTAKVYINLPYSNQPIFFKDYFLDEWNDDAPVYFDAPTIEGYEFVCWKDEKGQSISGSYGLHYSDMEKDVCNYYGEYRKVELHIIEFRINNEVVGYREFYDTYSVTVSAPAVTLSGGEEFSGWKNSLVKPYAMGDTLLFYTGDYDTYEYAKMDFVFNGYIYRTEDAYHTLVTFQDGVGTSDYELFVNLGSEMKFDGSLDGTDVGYELIVHYGYSNEKALDGTVTRSDGEYIVSIPTLEELKTRLGIESAEEINFFEIVVSEC